MRQFTYSCCFKWQMYSLNCTTGNCPVFKYRLRDQTLAIIPNKKNWFGNPPFYFSSMVIELEQPQKSCKLDKNKQFHLPIKSLNASCKNSFIIALKECTKSGYINNFRTPSICPREETCQNKGIWSKITYLTYLKKKL